MLTSPYRVTLLLRLLIIFMVSVFSIKIAYAQSNQTLNWNSAASANSTYWGTGLWAVGGNPNFSDIDADGILSLYDQDDDGDGFIDTLDAFPLNPLENIDTDADGIGNVADSDDDGDGVLDENDLFPLDKSEWFDTDSDGVGNNSDSDDDGDWVLDQFDIFPLDSSEWQDTDSDGIGNNADPDDDGNGIEDSLEPTPDYEQSKNLLWHDVNTTSPRYWGASNWVGGGNSEFADIDNDGLLGMYDEDDDGDGIIDNLDAFPLDKSESEDIDADGIGDNADTDDDNDGMSDSFENEYGFNSLDASDAELDLDNDGVTNLEEFNAGTDPTFDDYAPIFNVEVLSEINVTAVGKYTSVVMPDVTVIDGLDGELKAINDIAGPLLAGRHVVTWTAEDAAGNTSTNTQVLVIHPLAQILGHANVKEGSSIEVEVSLTGVAQSYPVTIPLTYAGSASSDTDYNAPSTVSIDESLKATVTITANSDQSSEGNESIELTLGTPDKSVGLSTEHTALVTIVEEPVQPLVTLSVIQLGVETRVIDQSKGTVTVTSSIKDINGLHATTWSMSDNRIVLVSGDNENTVTFDPSNLVDDFYILRADVTDDEFSSETYGRDVQIEVTSQSRPIDTDVNGVPDQYDGHTETHMLGVINAGYLGEGYVTNVGSTLTLGNIARQFASEGEITVEVDTITDNSLPSDEGVDRVGALIDLEMELPVVDSSTNIRFIQPTANGLTDYLVLRVLVDEQWQDFVVDEHNAIKSANAAQGNCPALNSTAYKSGLIAGTHCISIEIQDGGPNDGDGQINGVINLTGIGVLKRAINVSGQLLDWVGKTIKDVSVAINDESQTEIVSGEINTDGTFSLGSELTNGAAILSFTKVEAIDAGTRPITSADALAALKIAVGLNPNSSGEVSPYQFIAADINNDGRVTSADALAILKVAVGLESLPEMAWVFMDSNTDTSAINKSSVPVITNNVNVTLPTANDASYIGIMKGNVNGL
jgi:hypothetical protein